MKRVLSLLTASLVVATMMSTQALDLELCEPYIVMYTDNAENDCFTGQAMELALNLALPTLKGWEKASGEMETRNSGNSGNNGGNSGNNGGNSGDTASNPGDTGTNTSSPTASPNSDPASSPTAGPTTGPTAASPNSDPTSSPTVGPTTNPAASTSDSPSDTSSDTPSDSPSDTPSDSPRDTPSDSPIDTPTDTGGNSVDPNADDAYEFAASEQVMAYMDGLKNGYALAVVVGFDEGYKSAIKPNLGSGDDTALTMTVQGAGEGHSQAYLASYSDGFTVGYEEGYKAGHTHGDYKGRYGDKDGYIQGYEVGQANSTAGTGTRRKMFEIDDEQSIPLPQLDMPQLRGSNHHQPQRKTQTKAYCKHLCFHQNAQKRLQCQVLGCFQKYPGLTARRRRELQEAGGGGVGDGNDEVIMNADNTMVFQTVITAEGIDGGLDFKNLIADLLAKKCNIPEVGFEVWFMCPDPVATAALLSANNNNTI